jgi:predicted nucleic acid-binding protein
MADVPLVLVDTSVWVRFFRMAQSPEARTLDALLALAAVTTCAPIRAEVVSGAPTPREFARLRALFDALSVLEPPGDVWRQLEACRFALARRGHQASVVDLFIALTAQAHRVAFWTLDEDFRHLSAVVPIRRYLPEVIPPQGR